MDICKVYVEPRTSFGATPSTSAPGASGHTGPPVTTSYHSPDRGKISSLAYASGAVFGEES